MPPFTPRGRVPPNPIPGNTSSMFTTRPELLGTFGMVSSTHWLTSATAMAILEDGGNAFDAAVAGGLMLHVCEPHLNGPGGDMPAILHDGKTGETKILRARAPRRRVPDRPLQSEGLNLIPGTGLPATVVPGAFDAWMLMLRDYGTKTVEDVRDRPRLCRERRPCRAALDGDRRNGRRTLPRRMDDFRQPVAGRWQPASARQPRPTSRWRAPGDG